MADQPIRLLIAEDDVVLVPILQQRIAKAARSRCHCVGSAHSVAELLPLVEEFEPHLVLLDLHRSEGLNLKAVELLQARIPDLGAIVVLDTLSDGPEAVLRARKLGVRGLISRTHLTEELPSAIDAVLAGASWVSGPLSQVLEQEYAALWERLHRDRLERETLQAELGEKLSPREIDVIQWIGQGLTNAQIARELGTSEGGIRQSVTSILKKMRLKSRTEAALHVALHGWQRRSEQTAAELEHLQKQLNAILQSAGEGIWIIDRNTRTTFVSERMAEILGCTVEEMLGRPPTDFMPAEEISAFHERRRRYQAGDNRQHEARYRHQDGRDLWMVVSGRVVRDSEGEQQYGIAMLTDITAQKSIEERFRLVASLTSDGIWDWDLTTDTVSWLGPSDQVLGYPTAEIEQSVWWVTHTHPEDRKRVADSDRRARNGTDTFWSERYQFLLPDGTYTQILDQAVILRDAEGKAVRMVGAVIDLSRRPGWRGVVGQVVGGKGGDRE